MSGPVWRLDERSLDDEDLDDVLDVFVRARDGAQASGQWERQSRYSDSIARFLVERSRRGLGPLDPPSD